MVRTIAKTASLVLGLALAGPATAQGFSGGGAGGVAALRGATASPGYGGGFGPGGAVDGPVPRASEPAAGPRRMAPTDVDYAPREERSGAFGLPF